MKAVDFTENLVPLYKNAHRHISQNNVILIDLLMARELQILNFVCAITGRRTECVGYAFCKT